VHRTIDVTPDVGQPDPTLPTVSVLTTSYDHARWLSDTLDSVSRQDYPSIEHLVVDDGSTDGSVDVLAARENEALRWASTPNIGQARALNEAFRMSSGEILGWLSSDDAYYDRRVVTDVVRAFAQHPRADLVYGHAVLIAEDGLQLNTQWVPPVERFGWEPPMHILQPATFVRRSAVGESFVNEAFDLAMDTELWLRLRGPHRFLRLDRILAAERHHAKRKSYTREEIALDEARRLDAAYPPAGGRATHRRDRKWGFAYRLAGLTLVPRVDPRPDAFNGHLDSRAALVRRQLLVPRSRMPSASRAREP
jgi:glycosyltransferase involved in cell wall biosynthesis